MSRVIEYRLRDFENRIVGYEKWYEGSLDKETILYTANPQWLYSSDNEYWNPTPINHRFKDQWTGLFDKNGKKIFKGDLLKVSVMTHSLESVHRDHYYEQNFVDEVKFEHGYFYCRYFLWEIATNAEIVGNIYEHPNLLNNEVGND